jgi:hypothetical protein
MMEVIDRRPEATRGGDTLTETAGRLCIKTRTRKWRWRPNEALAGKKADEKMMTISRFERKEMVI